MATPRRCSVTAREIAFSIRLCPPALPIELSKMCFAIGVLRYGHERTKLYMYMYLRDLNIEIGGKV